MSLTLAAGFLGIEHFTPPWDVFFLPLFNLLVLAYRLIFSDFALAIIVFTVVVRTLLAPLFVQQIRSQREMQRMQPLIREVQRKHKGNTQKITQETQALYKEHGVNPFGGCLPLVLQLPILYSLYQALIRASGVVQGFTPSGDAQTTAFEALKSQHLVNLVSGTTNHYQVAVSGACNLDAYNHLPQFLPLNCQLLQPLHLDHAISTVSGWLINPFTGLHLDLAQPDHVFALVVPGTTFAISLIAILAAVLQFVQVKMTSPRPNPDDPTTSATSTMTYVFPLLTVFWGGLFPSGLILYWVVYTAYLVGHQFLMMGWGNLFPIFSWNPSWGGAPAELRHPLRRGSGQVPDAASQPRSTGSRPPTQPRELAGTPSATGASRSTSTSAGQRANPGERASTAQRPGPTRGGRSKKRGRRR
jgi:YidC/Oxa1 family membrane protein insertase